MSTPVAAEITTGSLSSTGGHNQKQSPNKQQHTSPTKDGKSATQQHVRQNNSTTGCSTPAGGKDQSEKQDPATPEGFRDDKYIRFYRPELGSNRRALTFEGYTNELKKCADRRAKQSSTLFTIDRDLHSIGTLLRTAEFRTKLLKQRIEATTKRVQELEKNQ